MGSAYRLHRRTCYTKKEPPRRISEVLKVAATSSPTIFRSAVPSAMLSLCPVLSLLPAPLSALCCPRPSPLCRLSPLSHAPARRRRAHRRPPRATPMRFISHASTPYIHPKPTLSTNPQTLSSNPYQLSLYPRLTHKNLWSLSQ